MQPEDEFKVTYLKSTKTTANKNADVDEATSFWIGDDTNSLKKTLPTGEFFFRKPSCSNQCRPGFIDPEDPTAEQLQTASSKPAIEEVDLCDQDDSDDCEVHQE